jgi:hypothetical protein
MSAVAKSERPAVSLSQAGHCRMELFLAAKGAAKEEPLPHVQRKFDMGHLTEALLFGQVAIPNGSQETVGGWWDTLDTVTDHSTGTKYSTREIELDYPQFEVEVDGFLGHLDRIGGPDPIRCIDSKSMPSYSWQRNITSDLMANPFSREMVIQQNLYIHGVRLKRPDWQMDEWMLALVNRDDLSVAVRVGKYDPRLVAEGRERLSWARAGAEPVPDWSWSRGQDIPLRCSYCSFRDSCGEMRGLALELRIEKNQPKWRVK